MVREGALAELIEKLVGASSLESAARPCLDLVLEIAQRHLEESTWRGEATLRRAIAHCRPDEGYRGIVVLQAADKEVVAAPGDEFVISSMAWEGICRHRCPVAFDVETGRLRPQHADGDGAGTRAMSHPVSSHTITRLQRRGATHILVLPLRGHGGQPVGMVSVEVDCPAAVGKRFVWEKAASELKLACDIAAPYLAQLPAARGGDADADSFLPVVGPTMAPLIRLLSVFARQDETLLIGGPTGSGKSRLARWCHEHSARREGPFEVVDLLSIPDEMQMGELFGWKRGAFTGAAADHTGFVSRAEGGTLFIDEIDKLSPRAQAGLLYLIEQRRYRVLGEGPERSCDLRFVVGTNADLREEVAKGRFREDLYYRINVLAVTLPPLEGRRDEIVDWARFMLERRHAEAGLEGRVSLTPKAEQLLTRAEWPGNLRQLDNVLRRSYVLSLARLEGRSGGVEVGVADLDQSLLHEQGISPGIADPLLAAARFVAQAALRDGSVDLDLLSGLRGLTLAEAIRMTGSKEEAFRVLGREGLVKSRNHHKTLQREFERAEELCRALGTRGPERPHPDGSEHEP